MARSINKRQESYLKTMHLDDLGSSKDSFQPVMLDDIEQALVELATLFKTMAEQGLNVKNAVDTGKLAESIQFDAVSFMGGVYSVDISVLDYYAYVNSGVKGTQNKSINSPFEFKNNHVSKDFMLSIRKWLIRHGLKSNSRPAKKNPIGTERKTQKFQESSNAMAYAIAVSIKKKGLKPTHFWDDAGAAVEKEMENTIGNAFAISIVNMITNNK